MAVFRALAALLVVVLAVAVAPAQAHERSDAHHSLRQAVTDQSFYFVMADRFENGTTANDLGGLPADRLKSGFDPTATGFYHGGDLQGIVKRLDYIQRLGTTAIWLTPSFKNKPVQLEDGPSAGYHGYWITDFTQIDPHLGTNDDLRQLVDAAHARGMKVYFDIITNHTADVIDYREAHRPAYVSKDVDPYRDASGRAFDDRDFAGGSAFPRLAADTSFPFTPFVPAGEQRKVPDWLNDVTLYHNRGNTTFTGENSLYGDFFGLDDLFTEHPRVVRGLTRVYETWIADFGIDGFRIDTMKHVNDEFWQQFLPDVLSFAHRQGKKRFFMFGEVFDTSRPFTSHFTTHDRAQAVLDFPFQAAAQGFAAGSAPTDGLRDLFAADDWYTDGDSNAYQLPTFLGNHDMGRIGMFIRNANPGATDDEVLARDRLAHALMYLSRGNPVVYYGDEQGFVGDGGDQGARQDMFPSQVASYNDDDLIGTDATTADANFDQAHPLYRGIGRLARLTQRHGTLRNGAQQSRYSQSSPGVYAFSRINRDHRREYVVALNNAESSASASIPTYVANSRWTKVFGPGPKRLATGGGKTLDVTLPALSAVVYKAKERIPLSRSAPSVALDVPREGRDRLEVGADLGRDQFADVTFLAKAGKGRWKDIGTDDNAPYRVFHDVSDIAPGARVKYRAVVLDNAHHTRSSRVRSSRLAPPAIALEAPTDNGRVRGTVEVRAVATPDHADYSVTFQRSVDGAAFTAIGTDSSSPVYTAFDDAKDLPDGARVRYRAVLRYAAGRTVISDARTVTVVQTPVTTAIVHYDRPVGDWGLHLWGDAVVTQTAWEAPLMPSPEGSGSVFTIPLKDDTKPVNFIVHRTPPNSDEREPGGDRSFVPLDHPEVWLKQGDPAIYFSP